MNVPLRTSVKVTRAGERSPVRYAWCHGAKNIKLIGFAILLEGENQVDRAVDVL